jgi:hypothetical protein
VTDRNDPPDDLDDELRRLFADDRLTLPVARDATPAVLAGARRRRRNRTALGAAGGVLAVVAVVFVGAVLSGIGRPAGTVRAAAPLLTTTATTAPTGTATATPVPATTSAADPSAVLGPYGYSKLELGMSVKEASAIGQLRVGTPTTVAGCLRYTILFDVLNTAQPTTPDVAAGTVEPRIDSARKAAMLQILVGVRDGIVELIAGPGLHTPEGIGIGSSRTDLADAYPTLEMPAHAGTTTVAADGNPAADYVFQVAGNGTVAAFSLRSVKSDCPS